MCVRDISREVSGFLTHRARNRSEPEKVRRNHGDEEPNLSEGSAAADRADDRFVQIHPLEETRVTPTFSA